MAAVVFQSAVTHNSPEAKFSLELLWIPHNVSGQIEFVATVVENYRNWWEGVKSQPITVTEINAVRSAPLQVCTQTNCEQWLLTYKS